MTKLFDKKLNDTDFPYNYICIEGNIGSGKTSLCNMIERDYNCRLMLEEFDDNPFLPYFYDDPERYGFTVELFFMTERYKQMQRTLMHQDLFRQFTVSDYAFVKTLLFANKNLPEEEFRLFHKMYEPLSKSFPQPDLLVYIHRSVDWLLVSIEKRGRGYEKNIKAEYLLNIQNAYFEYLRHISSIPVLILDLNTIDFVANKEHYEEITNLLKKQYRPGVHRVSLMV